jgi:hypothetical protein
MGLLESPIKILLQIGKDQAVGCTGDPRRRQRATSAWFNLVRSILILALGLSPFWMAFKVRAAVTLSSFTATPGVGSVLIEWTTATETDSSGFYVLRSLTEDGGYSQVSPFIPSTGDPLVGGSYEYTDLDVQDGTTYYYELEMVDVYNNSDFSDPISATPGPPTPTPTITPSPTATLTNTLPPTPSATPDSTATQEQNSTEAATVTFTLTSSPSPSSVATDTPTGSTTPAPTATRTPSRTPTRTPVASLTPTRIPTLPPSATPLPPPSATPTVQDTPTQTPTETTTPTDTLVPLGAITLVYPSATPTVSPTPQILPVIITRTPQGSMTAERRDLARLGLLVMAGVLWLLLAGWLYIFFRWGKL